MALAKKIARNLVFPAITAFGLERSMYHYHQKCMIIMYHGVVPSTTPKYNGRHFKLESFKKHLQYFSKHFKIVSLQEIFKYYQEGYQPKDKTLAITFDDGYLNNLNYAVPLLDKFNFPATFFVQGMSMDNPDAVTWPDVINLLKHHTQDPVIFDDQKFYPLLYEDFINKENNMSLIAYVKTLSYQRRSEFLNYLENKFNVSAIINKVDQNIWKLMGPEHVRQIAANPLFEIGSHSFSHYCLGNIDPGSVRKELSDSKNAIENVSSREIVSLAYPDGSYNEEVKKLSKEVGFKNLCAVRYQVPTDQGDKNILPRHGLSTTTTVPSNLIYLHKSFGQVGF